MVKDFSNHRFDPSPVVTALPVIGAIPVGHAVVVEAAGQMLRSNPALAILLIEKGQILFEGYNVPASAATPQFSWSMSKSLVAYTIGKLYCDKKIGSLDETSQSHFPALAGTVFGDSSIRNLLRMSSGAKDAVGSGNVYRLPDGGDDWTDLRGGRTTAMEIMHQFGKREIPSGREFRYLAYDTQALSHVADAHGGFLKNFETYIWMEIGAEAPGYWLLEKTGKPISQAGLSMVTRDWGRLAMHAIRMLKQGDDCTRTFMRDATSAQIENRSRRVGAAFRSYGYQTWTDPSFGDGKSFWWIGFGGQRVGIDAGKERIMVVSSWRESYMGDVYRLFERFQALPPLH